MKTLERTGRILYTFIEIPDSFEGMTEEERTLALTTIEETTKFLTEIRREIKKAPYKKGPDRIPPGLEPVQVLQVLDIFYIHHKMPNETWRGLWINIKTGQVVYHKDLCDPTDDGYLNGFQIAFDISTNKMVARNCDNIWKSLDKRGFKRVLDTPNYKELYEKWTNKS